MSSSIRAIGSSRTPFYRNKNKNNHFNQIHRSAQGADGKRNLFRLGGSWELVQLQQVKDGQTWANEKYKEDWLKSYQLPSPEHYLHIVLRL